MDIQALAKLIETRRSVRKWKADDVPDELLKKAVEMATWAPNGGNYQGWRFIVVKNKEVIKKMADAVQTVANMVASWPEAASWKEDVLRHQEKASFFRTAPVCIGVFIAEYETVMDKVLIAREPADPSASRIMGFRRTAPTGIQSAAAAITTMLLVFHEMGLGATWLASPLVAKKEIEATLNVPPGLALISLIAVGYPDESPQKDRKPVEQVMEFIR